MARTIDWERCRTIPHGVAAAMAALRFDAAGRPPAAALTGETLAKLDEMRLALVLGQRSGAALPEAICARLVRNESRLERLKASYFEIADELSAREVDYVVLRGLTHGRGYVPDPRARCQYDIDLLCANGSLQRAREALEDLGYVPLQELERFPTDHLPTMVRKTGWQWRGDYYDPEIPFNVDLHFRLWDGSTEQFQVPGLDEFWTRRTARRIDGRLLPCLHEADMLGAAALHALRHLLRGSLAPAHIYEIAHFLHTTAADAEFWEGWTRLHPPAMRRTEAVVFRLAEAWFACDLAAGAMEEVSALPEKVERWFAEYAVSPVEARFRPNKNELWLHLALLESGHAKRAVLLRRLAPARLPGPVDAVHIPENRLTWRIRMRRRVKYAEYVASRVRWHMSALWPVLREAVRRRVGGEGITRSFWVYLVLSAVYDFGLYIFFLLYNLYLLDLGYREDFLGRVTGAMTIGGIAGALPAGLLARRFGLRASVVVCIAGVALISGLRAFATAPAPLLVLAFADGALAAIWAVSYLPAIARSTGARQRPLAYTICTVEGIGVGVLAGIAGGLLPNALLRAGVAAVPLVAKRISLLLACACAAFAVAPALRLRFPPAAPEEKRVRPQGPFLARFLVPLAFWSFATGAFNPFFSAFFSRHVHMSVPAIGGVYAAGQAVQVAGLLFSPLLFKRFGTVPSIAAMQVATGCALALLAASPARTSAALAYSGYAAFQAMSEPGLFAMLMRNVAPAEQSGASALNFFTVFTMNALAAWAAGGAFVRFGYPAVLAVCGCVAIAAALLFRSLLRRFE